MKYMFYILFIFSSIQSAIARNGNASNESERASLTPEQVVQIQLDAYNRRDIDAFLDTYADDIKMYNFPDKLTTSGKTEMKFSFSMFFASNPELHARVTKKIIKNNFVIFYEVVTGINEGKDLEVIAIYEVNSNNKIQNLWFIW